VASGVRRRAGLVFFIGVVFAIVLVPIAFRRRDELSPE
jgi:hypothetical protein